MPAPRRVLHVDPDADARSRVADALDDAAIRSYAGVETAREARSRLDTDGIDCVLTAVDLPDGSGVSLLEAIRESHGGVAVVFCDDVENPRAPARALNHGADGYVHRGEQDWAATLVEQVVDAVANRRSRQQDRQAASVLDSLFEQVPGHIHLYVKDETGTHIRVTDTLFDADMLLGKADYEVVGVPPGESETYQDDLHVIDTGERIVEREERSPLYEKWLSTWKVPWRDGDDVVGLIGFTEDITERKRYEQRLETLTERFELALEVTGVGVIDWDLSTRDVNFHGAARSILGLEDRETLSPSTVRDIVHPEDTDAVDQLLGGEGERPDLEVEFRVPGGEGWRWVEIAGECRTDESGVPERVIGILTDTTEQKERERAQRRHRRRITALHDIAVTLQHSETEAEVCERTIDAAKEILAFDQCAIMHEEDGHLPIVASSDGLDAESIDPLDATEGLAGQCFQQGTPSVVGTAQSHPIAKPQGAFQSVLSVPVGDHGVFQAVSATPDYFDSDDLELAELLITHTATALTRLDREGELQEQTAKLRRQNERLDQFASIVSHDLRNPLEVARGHLELVEADDEHLDRVAAMHDRMDELLDDLLTIAREGERVTDPEPIDLATIANGCWQSVETDGASLEVMGSLSFAADPTGIQQLLENLYRNAVEHGQTEDRAVTIRIGPLEDGFYVEDDGPGIPDSMRDEIFETGFSTDDDGTGYGLSIVTEIADAHGWQVSAGESADGGARFEITGVTVEDSD